MASDDKDKKAAAKDLQKMQQDMGKLRDLHEELGKLLDAHDKGCETLLKQMQADNQKQQAERWKIQQETQAKIFETIQDLTKDAKQTQDKAYKKWDEYIRN